MNSTPKRQAFLEVDMEVKATRREDTSLLSSSYLARQSRNPTIGVMLLACQILHELGCN